MYLKKIKLYLKVFNIFLKIISSIDKYENFLNKKDGTGKNWTLYKRPLFQNKINMKKEGMPETKAHHFVYHVYSSLESKTKEKFTEEMFENIALSLLWYISLEEKQEQTETIKIEEPMEKEYGKNHIKLDQDSSWDS